MEDSSQAELTLADGTAVARIDAASGGRLASLDVGGRELMLTEPRQLPAIGHLMWGCFLMVPWVGRLRDGTLRFGSRHARFPPNHLGHALHGLGAAGEWQVQEHDARSATLRADLADLGWPFGGVVTQVYQLSGNTLTFSASVAGGAESFPLSVGWHPWFSIDPGTTVQVDSGSTLELDHETLPTGRVAPVDERTDLRRARPVGGLSVDDVYIEPSSPVVIEWDDTTLLIEFGSPINNVVVFATAYSLSVEPQTAWPDAVTLQARGFGGTGIVVSDPAETFEVQQRWRWVLK